MNPIGDLISRGGINIHSEPTSANTSVQLQRPESKQWVDFRIQDKGTSNVVNTPAEMDIDLASPNTNANQVRFSNPPGKKASRKRDKNGHQPN